MSEPAPIAFLHTARPNVEMFRDLMARIAPSVSARHELLESVMLEASDTGVLSERMRHQTEDAVQRLVADGAVLVVCTCSTIGGVAEATTVERGARVTRIDRAMAEAAVASGCRIVVAATLQSTVRPTRDLMQQVAAEMGRPIAIVEVLCADAWEDYQRGDQAAYARRIASAVAGHVGVGDIVVLAQASMAPAVRLIEPTGIRALASPELGVRAAVDAYRRR